MGVDLFSLVPECPQALPGNLYKQDFFHERSCRKTETEASKLAASCPEIALPEIETLPGIITEARTSLPTYDSLVSPSRGFTIRWQPPPPPPFR